MKYYLFQGRADKMSDDLFPVLMRNQPDVVELTKEDYENRMGIRPKGSESKKTKDVRKPVAKDSAKQTITSLPGTRGEAIKILRERGFEYKDLKRKTKAQLIEML